MPCDIMLVGEGPGANEEVEGKPFVGDAGDELNKLLAEAGLLRGDVFISNVVRCRPPNNRSPKTDEVEACRLYLMRELDEVNPKVIVALGGSAADALTGKSKVGENRGRVQHLRKEFRRDTPVLITYHPASFLHNRRNAPKFKAAIGADLQLALKITKPNGVSDVHIATSLNTKDAVVAITKLAKAKRLACDLEWEVLPDGGSYPWSRRSGRLPRFISISIAGCVNGENWAVAVESTDTRMTSAIFRLISRIPTTFHNAGSDLLWLYSLDVLVNLDGDTLLLASMLNFEHSISLEVLASIMTDVDPTWKAETKKRKGSGAFTVGVMPRTRDEWEKILERNALDSHATLKLEDALLDRVRETGRESVLPLYKRLVQTIPVLTRAAINGVPFDEDLLIEYEAKASIALEALRQRVADKFGVPGYATKAPGSQLELAYAIERQTGLELPKTEKRREPSIQHDFLELHVDKHPGIADLVKLITLKKLHGTYLSPWRLLIEWQGEARVHTMIKLFVASTGRSSAEQDKGGTLQQFPRGKARNLVRARPGYQILQADQGQIELRIGAWIAKEERLLSFFRDGIDPHRAIVAWVHALQEGLTLEQFLPQLEKRIEAVSDRDRQNLGKPVNFGFEYGMYEKTFIETARREYGVEFTMPQAKTARRGYFVMYPGFARWHEDSWKWVHRGYVDTVFGRRRLITSKEGEDPSAPRRRAANTEVQSPSSDLSLLGVAESSQTMLDEGMMKHDLVRDLGFIHDAGLWEVHESVVDHVRAIVKPTMEDPRAVREILGYKIPVPLNVDFKVGQTWGSD